MHPLAGILLLDRGGLSHLHDDGLDEVECDDVTAYAPHADAIADVEGFAAQDDEVAGETGDYFLQGEGEACAHEADAGGEPRWIVEPDGEKADEAEQEGDETDSLSSPEGCLLARSAQLVRDRSERLADEEEGDEENGGDQQL